MENQIKTLIDYRQELAEEESYLKKILNQIQEQIGVLEVERLALKQMEKSEEKTVSQTTDIKLSPNSQSKELNLNVPSYINSRHNVVEEEDDDEDE